MKTLVLNQVWGKQCFILITMPIWTYWSWTWETNLTKEQSKVAKELCAAGAQRIDGLFGNGERADVKAGILDIQLTNSASIPNENKWKGEGRKEGKSRKSLIHTFAFVLSSWSGKWGEQVGSRKLQCMEVCTVLTTSMIMQMGESRCSRCRDKKWSILIKESWAC